MLQGVPPGGREWVRGSEKRKGAQGWAPWGGGWRSQRLRDDLDGIWVYGPWRQHMSGCWSGFILRQKQAEVRNSVDCQDWGFTTVRSQEIKKRVCLLLSFCWCLSSPLHKDSAVSLLGFNCCKWAGTRSILSRSHKRRKEGWNVPTTYNMQKTMGNCGSHTNVLYQGHQYGKSK